METRERTKLLRAKALDIDKWMTRDLRRKAVLRSQVEAFSQAHETYNRTVAEAMTRAKRVTWLQNQGNMPGIAWRWVYLFNYKVAILEDASNSDENGAVVVPEGTSAMGFWAEHLPFDPLGWTEYHYGRYLLHGERPSGGDSVPSQPTAEQGFMCKCALMAVIWDMAIDRADCDRLTPADPWGWPEKLWLAIDIADPTPLSADDYELKTNRILHAWEDVKREVGERLEQVKAQPKQVAPWQSVRAIQLDDPKWNEFLDSIATEVDKLILLPGVLNTFRHRIGSFAEQWEKHCAETERKQQWHNAHWQEAKADPRLRDETAGPPEEGWVWESFFGIGVQKKGAVEVQYELDGRVSQVSLPDGPPCEMPADLGKEYIAAVEGYIEKNRQHMAGRTPGSSTYEQLKSAVEDQRKDIAIVQAQLQQLDPEELHSVWIVTGGMWWRYLGRSDAEFFGCWRPPQEKITDDPCESLIPLTDTEKLPPARNRTEEYQRYYVTLATIHDHQLSGCESITQPVWTAELAARMWFRFSKARPWGPDRAYIETALNRVRVELEAQRGNPEVEAEATRKIDERAGQPWDANAGLQQEIADEVETIITGEPATIARFREKIKAFNTAWHEYWRAKKDEPQPYDDPTGTNGRPGYEYDPEDKIWEPIDPVPLPPDPVNWEIEDKLCCYYTTVAVIYDCFKGTDAPFRLCDGILDTNICVRLIEFATGYREPSRLRTALRWVKADLVRQRLSGEDENLSENGAPERPKACKEPSKIDNQAYKLYYSTSYSQEKVAALLTRQHQPKIPYSQGAVSKMIKRVRRWRKENNLPVEDAKKKGRQIPVDPRTLDMGERTDGRGTGDPRHKRGDDPEE